MQYTEASTKTRSKEWWNSHPMDYQGFKAAFASKDDDELTEYFKVIDKKFHRDAYFAHDDNVLFSKLIDYRTLNGKKVLEVGCGLGSISAEFARHGSDLTAVDISSKAVHMTRERFRVFNLRGKALNADAECLPFPDNTFDFIWSWGVLHHTPDVERAVSEIYRVLKPEGRIGIMIYHKNSLYNCLNVTFRYGILQLKLLKMSQRELWNRYTDGKNIGGCPLARYFSKNEARQLFKPFKDLKLNLYNQKEGIVNVFPKWTKVRPFLYKVIPDSFFDFVFSRLGFALFIQGRK